MADTKENDHETVRKRKKRQRSSVLKNEDKISLQQFEESYAEGFMKKMIQKLDNTSFQEILSILEKFESSSVNIKEQFEKIENIFKNHEDLQQEFLGLLEPYQALECGKLMMYFEICNMKNFIRNLMSHFKRQPHMLKKIIDKLSSLTENENVQQDMLEEAIAPFLQKNSSLMEDFYKLLPEEKPPDSYFSSENVWEDFSIEEVYEEETFEIPQAVNEITIGDSKKCIYNCKHIAKSSLCPICNVKFINGRMYVTNGKILRPANIIFDSSDELENIRRLCGKNHYFTPTSSKARTHKRIDVCNKDTSEERLSPLVTGAESEEELGEHELPARKRRQRNPQRLKVRFKSSKKKSNNLIDQIHIDDTAPSNDEVSCDDTGKEDNGYNSCDDCVPIHPISENNTLFNKEVVQLKDMELNISANCMPGLSTGSLIETYKQPKNSKLKVI